MFCYLQDCNVLPSSGLECFAIIRIATSCHNEDYSVLPSFGLQCFVIVWNSMFCLTQVCNIWHSSVLPSSGIAKFDFYMFCLIQVCNVCFGLVLSCLLLVLINLDSRHVLPKSGLQCLA